MQIQYLEIVTADIDAFCATQSEALGLSFSAPDPLLGNARTAPMASGGVMGVRPPMHDSEEPVTRPYYGVDDVAEAHARALSAGAHEMHPPLEIPGKCTFSILTQGHIQFGFWKG